MRRTFAFISVFALVISMLALPAAAAPKAGLHCPGHNSDDVEKFEDPDSDYVPDADLEICVKSGTSQDGVFNTGIITTDGETSLREYLEAAGITGGAGEGRDVSYYVVYPPDITLEGEITIEKTAAGSFDREWTWDIEKVGYDSDDEDEREELTEVFFGADDHDPVPVYYEVTVSAVETDKDYTVSGIITISNTGDYAADIDSLDDLGTAITSCVFTEPAPVDPDTPVPFAIPGTLEMGEEIDCAYTVTVDPEDLDVDDDTELFINLATVTGTFVDDDTTPFEETADALFDFELGTETDECIDVEDDQYGALGEVCAEDLDDEGKYAFNYTVDIDPADYECGFDEFVNVASFEANDTEQDGSDSWTVDIEIVCVQWCSPGFWRNNPDATQTAIDHEFGEGEKTAGTLYYNDYFPGAPLNGNPSLWEVLQSPQTYGGGAFNNVGSLLSSWHDGVAYGGGREGSCELPADSATGGKTGPGKGGPKK